MIRSGKTPSGGAENYLDSGIPLIRSQNVHFDGLRLDDVAFIDASMDHDLRASRLVAGDVLLNITGASIGRCCVFPKSIGAANVNQHVCAIRPKPALIDSGFLSAFLSSAVTQWLIKSGENGTSREGLTFEQIGNFTLLLPPMDEQRTIATFLDRETARLDGLIEKRRRMITLLHEKRSSLITQAVTRGLNPDVAFKDSGIEWLGQIPSHWHVKRLRHIGKAVIGLTYDPADVVEPSCGVLVLRSSNVQSGRIELEDKVFVKTTVPPRLLTRIDDILICSRNGSRALIGKSAKIDLQSSGVTFGAFMTIFRSPHAGYLYYVFNSRLFDYQSGAFLTSTINQLTVSNLNGFEVPLPPEQEQKEIVSHINKEAVRVDALIERNQRSVLSLTEYRASLITAAVTGQIDVRAFTP